MANDLTTPLTGRKRKAGGPRRPLPVARTLFAVLVLIAVAFVLRLVLTDDPNGGRPSQEVAITSTQGSNDLANQVSTGPTTITADPQQFPAGSAITAVPSGTLGAGSVTASSAGAAASGAATVGVGVSVAVSAAGAAGA